MTQGFQQQNQTFGPEFRSARKPQQTGAQLAPAAKTPILPVRKAEPRTFG